jgi:amidohydrolase
MHACGHDGHTAILLGVTRQLVQSTDDWQGKVVLVFQPAEEGRGGAERMIAEGLLDAYNPDCCGGLHLWSEAPTGTALITDGPFMASTDRFAITIKGQGGHGAIPHHAKDPVVAAAQMVLSLQTLVSREVDPAESCVLTVGYIQGGDAFNVIPDQVVLGGTVRTFSTELQQKAKASVIRIVEGIAAASDMEVDVSYEHITIPTVNVSEYCQTMREVAGQVEGVTLGEGVFRTMAGEDMGFFLNRCPGVYFFLGAGNAEVGAIYPHHHPRFQVDEAAIPLGVEMLTRYAWRCTAA